MCYDYLQALVGSLFGVKSGVQNSILQQRHSEYFGLQKKKTVRSEYNTDSDIITFIGGEILLILLWVSDFLCKSDQIASAGMRW